MIKHMPGYTSKEMRKLNPDIPIWKRREALLSPLIIPIGIGYIIFAILYGIYWLIKWTLLSWISPFIYSPLLCKMGFHKYRAKHPGSDYYECRICQKEIEISKPW